MRNSDSCPTESKSDIELLHHFISANNRDFEEYVLSLCSAEKRCFIEDTSEIINKTKHKYRNALYFHLFVLILFLLSSLNVRLNYSLFSVIMFVISFNILIPSTIELIRRWRTVRFFKIIKKVIHTIWLGESDIEVDDKEFFTLGSKWIISKKK